MTRRPLLTPAQRATLLSLCTAAYGLAIGIASFPHWIRPASPDQLPGFLKSHDLDAHIGFRFFGALVLITIAVTYAMRPIVNLLTRPDTRAWARNSAVFAMLTAVWYATLARELSWTVIPAAVMIAICVALRRIEMQFSRRDAILFASFAPALMAILDVSQFALQDALVIAAALIVALRLAIVFIRRGRALEAPLCFTFSPLALMLESHFLSRDQRHAGWPALLTVIVTPILLRIFMNDSAIVRRRLRIAIAFAIYPIAVYGYISAAGLLAAEGKPRVSFFEEMQHVTPAGEMLRGAKPYVDVVPPHGLIQDALVDYVLLRTGPHTLGNVLRGRLALNALLAIVCYAIGAAATGSADLGFLGFGAAAILGQGASVVRFGPTFVTLWICVAALRRRKPRWLIAAGAMSMIAVLTSIDFGVYAIAISIFAALRFQSRDARLRALGAGFIGGFVTGLIAMIAMMIGGYFTAFLRVTLFEVPKVGAAYTLTPFDPTPALNQRFPEVLAAVVDRTSLAYIVWIASLLALAIVLANGWRAHGRKRAALDAILAIVFWVVIAGLSYAERHHLYFQMIIGPLLVAVAYRASRARSTLLRLAAPVLTLLILINASFTTHFAIVGWLRHSRGPIEQGWREISLPRARGAFFRDSDIVTLDSITKYMTTHLGPDDTFFDFTNRGLTYFLLDKPMPVRFVEVAYYEAEDRQREVIAKLESNPHVRAAIVPLPKNDASGVDLVGNDVRAPLVWKYLQEHFEPDFQEGAVVIWKRK